MENKRIIEVNGIKMEVDLREAKRIDSFKVGDRVKLLKKSYSSYDSYYGVIIGFDEFKVLPTIIIAYLTYNDLKFEFINSETKESELCALNEHDFLNINISDVFTKLEDKKSEKERELKDIENKINYLKKNLGKIFSDLDLPLK